MAASEVVARVRAICAVFSTLAVKFHLKCRLKSSTGARTLKAARTADAELKFPGRERETRANRRAGKGEEDGQERRTRSRR